MAIGQPMESFKKEDVHMVHGNQERECSDHGHWTTYGITRERKCTVQCTWTLDNQWY